MAHMYIALVDTPGFFAALIRGFLRQRYIHVVIASDAELREAYSVGRRNPAVPVFAGFEKEDKNRILRAFPTAYYRICELECTEAQKRGIMKQLQEDYQRRFYIHYAVLGLPFILMNIPFYQGSVYLLVVYCKGIAGKWDSDRREAFLACDAEGFLCIWQDARDIRGKIMRNCGREPVL